MGREWWARKSAPDTGIPTFKEGSRRGERRINRGKKKGNVCQGKVAVPIGELTT